MSHAHTHTHTCILFFFCFLAWTHCIICLKFWDEVWWARFCGLFFWTWKGQIKLFLKKIILKISRITDAIGFYILKSSIDASWETSCDASQIDRCGKQCHHYLNNIIIFHERLVWLTVKLSQVESFPYPNKQGTPEEGRRIQQPKCCVTTNNNKDEDNSPKNNRKYCMHCTKWKVVYLRLYESLDQN